jgi:mediator of RNA polymerase II transcription subunit 6
MNENFSTCSSRAGLIGRLLQDMSGTEFAVVHADPPSLFIIHKREGDRGPKSRVLASYVMLDSVIYQSPSVYEYASTKLVSVVFSQR